MSDSLRLRATLVAPSAPAPSRGDRHTAFPVRDYDLAATLTSGQAFGWGAVRGGWEGVVCGRWVRLTAGPEVIEAATMAPVREWAWLRTYLGLEPDLAAVQATFPADPPLQDAVKAWPGLRLLRQDPWECLASFLLSSAKQITQIQRVVGRLRARFGTPVAVPPDGLPAYSFPAPSRLARCTEADLRACGMGFRAVRLRAVAGQIARGELELASLAWQSLAGAREQLLRLPGVGPKIANCVLLFALGFHQAFPIDVWVRKALQGLYFPGRRVSLRQLQEFSEGHFGPYAGYAQQYLFHSWRMASRRSAPAVEARRLENDSE